MISVIALVKDGGSDAVSAEGAVPVSLTEFALGPEDVVIPEGGSLAVSNDGSQMHNLAVADTDLITADLLGGEADTLDLSSLPAGEYELFCEIAGHKEAGMSGTLVVGEGGHGGEGDHAMGSDADWEAMDNAMLNSMREFPAETEGKGNVPLEPTITADGAKRFELTASIVPWEVEPGKFVDAWAYNGMVPGPWIKVDVGDRVEVHIQNDLPMGTDIHWHGIKTPNEMDGVAPITQDLVRSGEDFLYEFTAEKKAVGMYHAHHHGQMQVPNGMLGVFQIGDVDLPRGRTISGTEIPADLEIAQEIPMVLNDAGVIGLSLNGKSFPATEPYPVERGDWIRVHYLNGAYRSIPCTSTNSRSWSLRKTASHSTTRTSPTVNVAPGERYTVLLNPDDPGTWVWHCHILNHVESDEGMFGMVTALVVS